MSERSASIVVDLGFGDAGKGLVTDFLCRELGAHTVVRFNGGAQAGHNVVTPDGRHHTFAQIGAGAFVPNVRTFLSRFMVVDPLALFVELDHLEAKGVTDAAERLLVSDAALVITPFHRAACRLREVARGAAAHGSCGVGVGEAVMDSLARGRDAVRADELFVDAYDDRAILTRKLRRIQERKREELRDEARDHPSHAGALLDPQIAGAFIDRVAGLCRRRHIACVPDEMLDALLREPGAVIFEGAQGVLLDEWRGFHPRTTWSTCTPHNALELIADAYGAADRYDGSIIRYGVTRTYATRHGAGPFPSEDGALALRDPNNVTGPWQGALRFGHLDRVLLRYAIEACGRIDAVALTHLDAVDRMQPWRACVAYEDAEGALFDLEDDRATRLRLGPAQDLAHQARITRALERARPVYREIDRVAPIASIEALLDRPVRIASSGPSAADARWV